MGIAASSQTLLTVSYFQYREVVRSSQLIMTHEMNLDKNLGKGKEKGYQSGLIEWPLQSQAWPAHLSVPHPVLNIHSGACSCPKLSAMSLTGISLIKDTTGTPLCVTAALLVFL